MYDLRSATNLPTKFPNAKAELISCPGNSLAPASAQACAELLPGYPDQVLGRAGDGAGAGAILMVILVTLVMRATQACQSEGRDGAFTCWCSQDRSVRIH